MMSAKYIAKRLLEGDESPKRFLARHHAGNWRAILRQRGFTPVLQVLEQIFEKWERGSVEELIYALTLKFGNNFPSVLQL